MPRPINALLPYLVCPRSGRRLELKGDVLVSQSGDLYPLVGGRPVLVRRPRPENLAPPPEAQVSRTIPRFQLPEAFADRIVCALHLGSGDVPCDDERVISCDVLPNPNVDVVCEAEHLPFRDNCFDYVESGAMFEHVHDPLRAFAEVRRVLAPGGRVRIDTAFMQSYHGFPGHFFNLTPQAVETYLVDDLVLEAGTVPDSSTPLVAITSLVERFLSYLPQNRRDQLLAASLGDVLERMKADPKASSPLLFDQSEYSLRAMAASYAVLARKPLDWAERRAELERSGHVEEWKAERRAYFTARMEVLLRHHEVGLYRMWVEERGPRRGADIEDVEDVRSILARAHVETPLDIEAVKRARAVLAEAEKTLRAVRDRWIAIHLVDLAELRR